MKTENNPRIYCGTYSQYNNGSLFGKWFDLTDYNSLEELYKAFSKYHKKENDPEFMFQDWENIPNKLIGESWLHDEIFDYIEFINNDSFGVDIDSELFMKYWNDTNSSGELSEVIESFKDNYLGCYDSFQDYADEIADNDLAIYKVPEFLLYHFDYKSYADEIKGGYHVIELNYDSHIFQA